LTIVGSFLTPFLGPFVTSLLLGEAVPIDPFALSLRLAAMIGAGALLAVLLRKALGIELIERRSSLFDGIGALAMVLTVIPIFDGATEQILRTQLISTPILRWLTGSESGGAMGLIWGNRNAALYLAALPQAPLFSLFVALYQFPMYMTPLLMRRFYLRK